MNVDFGFYPLRLNVDCGDFQIRTRDDFESSVADVKSRPFIDGDWIYAPPREQYVFGANSTRVLPYPRRIFGLPKTHTLSHKTNDPLRFQFLISCFGFFVGMRMSEHEAGFLDGTPIQAGVSNDILWLGDSLKVALSTADDFFTNNSTIPKVEVTIRAAVHSYLASDLPILLDYERFIHLYTAIEACYAAYELMTGKTKKGLSHKARIAFLSEKIGVSVPWWADGSNSFVADQRNKALHEGLFFDQPWGFSIWGGNFQQDPKQQLLLLEMQKLTCRVLISLLGIQDREYITSSVSDRQRHGIRLNKGSSPKRT